MTSSTHTSSSELAVEMLDLIQRLMRGSSAGTFTLLEELDLSLTQVKTLHILEGCITPRELSVKELAQRTGMSLPGASRTADGLLKRGFVERREDAADRRIKRLTLTAAGHDAVRRLEAVRLEGLEQYTATLSPAQRDALAGVLRTLPHKDHA